jgi:hypothetical protein
VNIVKTWKFEFQTNQPAKTVQVGERVRGSIGAMNASWGPLKLGVPLEILGSGLLGHPPRDKEADIIQTVGNNTPILKGQVASIEGDTIIIELSFYK